MELGIRRMHTVVDKPRNPGKGEAQNVAEPPNLGTTFQAREWEDHNS